MAPPLLLVQPFDVCHQQRLPNIRPSAAPEPSRPRWPRWFSGSRANSRKCRPRRSSRRFAGSTTNMTTAQYETSCRSWLSAPCAPNYTAPNPARHRAARRVFAVLHRGLSTAEDNGTLVARPGFSWCRAMRPPARRPTPEQRRHRARPPLPPRWPTPRNPTSRPRCPRPARHLVQPP